MLHEGCSSPYKNLDLGDVCKEELLVDLEYLKDKIHARLDQYVKIKIQKRGISILHNTYTGFDTEYVHIKSIYNRLVSVQTAVKKRTIIKIPCVDALDIGYVHPLTS